VQNNYGNVLRQRGQSLQAIAQYRAAIRTYPDYVDAYVNLAHTLREVGRLPEAEATMMAAKEARERYLRGR
jgi:tetratricopeptide (TPR) repeat protein